MAEDYLTDDEQWEAVKRWIVENGLWVVAGIVLGLAALFGYRYVDGSRNERALHAAALFDQMTDALGHDDRNRSRQIAAGLIQDFPGSPYADQAQLTLARLALDDGQPAGAMGPLRQVMDHSKDSELRHVARLRLARVLIDMAKPDEAIQLLGEDSPGSFAALEHEVRGDAYYAKKEMKSAITEYKAALGSDPSGANAGLLELKIADLGEPPAPAPATAMVPAPIPSNKAKP